MTTILFAMSGVLLASVVGGAAGFATSLLAAPLLLLLGFGVREVVVVNLTATLVTRALALVLYRRLVDWRGVAALVAGSAPGAVAGAFTVPYLNQQVLKTVTGVVICALGLFLLLHRPRSAPPPGCGLYACVGAVGGYLSTSISLNGPPVAMLLDRARLPPSRFVADFAGYFVGTNAISLAVLGLHGQIPGSLLWPALPLLAAAAIAGNQIGARLTTVIPRHAFQVVVKCLVIASGVATAVS
ncbi:sulfite exporter TauE/SafE family protein [Amycolatopsis alkalitolerans]|uniref:Probable membrane transporter protein n=1 Tax=Amycolatopsis alkalitolerans TaxID=2547244 RepID=A0A5C4M1D3_9PSEU|nr:sulfite exporter TauE/SafE family protein [Amycolatopsis alkalitolerans]TNC25737.1 sulfite exporter TauE/SafE family protein [Amycolatopsis alkalitolerans]